MSTTTRDTLTGQTTTKFSSPEIVCGLEDTYKADIWALGIILYKMLSGLRYPFEGDNTFKIIAAIRDKEPAELPSSVTPYILDLIKMLLDKNPDTRPDSSTLI